MICENCNRELKRNWTYCPYCGEESSEDLDSIFYHDLFTDMDKELKQINKLFSNALNLKTKQKTFNNDIFRKGIQSGQGGFSISISSTNGSKPRINVKKFGDFADEEIKTIKEKQPSLKERLLKKFMHKKISDKIEQPKSAIKRLANKLIYELDVPEIKSINDVDINKLENSTEIKAFGKDKTYIKVIPLDLDLNKHTLKDGKLILEFGLD